MQDSYKASLQAVLREEGGYVNHPKDPGGATNKGITQAVFDNYNKLRGKSRISVKLITSDEVERIYRMQYWDVVRGDELPAGLDYAVFDYAVNSGPSRAVKHLQEILKVPVDGAMGPQTLGAARVANTEGAVIALCNRRMQFLQNLPTWGTFGKGWTARVGRVKKLGVDLARNGPGKPVQAPVGPQATTLPATPADAPVGAPEAAGGLFAALVALFRVIFRA